MAIEAILALCALIYIQGTSGQCVPFCNNVGSASTGGSFVVTSSSPIAPTGISVVSNNQYDGTLVVEGSLPLLGSVAVEGIMGTAGAGAVSYGCGDDVVDIVEEGPIVTGITSDFGLSGLGYGYGSGVYGLSYGNGLYGLGLGYGNGLGLCYGNGLYGFRLNYGNGLLGYELGYGNNIYGLSSGCGLGAIYL